MSVDLSMWRRADGKSVRDAMAGELIAFAVSFTPDDDPTDVRTIVFRWPFVVTIGVVLGFYLGLAVVGVGP